MMHYNKPVNVKGTILPFGYKDPNNLPTNFNQIKTTLIDGHGAFKYIAIDITDKTTGQKKTVVRGQRWIFNEVEMYNNFINLEM